MSKERLLPHSNVAPVDDATDIPSSARTLLAQCTQRSGLDATPSIYGVLAQHPALFERLLGAGLGRMPDALLNIDQRELLILRTARNTGAEYEWTHHVRQALSRDFPAADLLLARDGSVDTEETVSNSLVDAADELHRDATLSSRSWQRLRQHFDDAQILEILMLVGYYRVFAHIVNACGVQMEEQMSQTFPYSWPIRAEEIA